MFKSDFILFFSYSDSSDFETHYHALSDFVLFQENSVIIVNLDKVSPLFAMFNRLFKV